MNLLSLYYSICDKVKMLIPIQSAFLKRKVIVYTSDIGFLIDIDMLVLKVKSAI